MRVLNKPAFHYPAFHSYALKNSEHCISDVVKASDAFVWTFPSIRTDAAGAIIGSSFV